MVNNKRIIAIIPARGGSKRIPRKNIIDFCGKPMISWTIEAAIGAGLFDKIVVSTDDVDIATVSKSYGAEVPFLRKNYADDLTPVSEATIDCIRRVQEELSQEFDIVIQLMPNCPIRNSDNIKQAVQVFFDNDHIFQLSCFAYGWMNPWWAHSINESYKAFPLFDVAERNKRSQDQERLYCPSGAIWIAKIPELIAQGSFYGNDYRFVPLSWTAAVDIDDEQDLKMAKTIHLLNV